MESISPETWVATLLEIKRQLTLANHTPDDNDWINIPSSSTDDKNNQQTSAATSSDIWPQQQWFIAFELIFWQIPKSISSLWDHQDDLLFFVYQNRSSTRTDTAPKIFARRRTATFPTDLQPGSSTSKHSLIDWKHTLLLNIVLQTEYSLTVCKCLLNNLGGVMIASPRTNETNPAPQQASTPSASILQVSKKVHASPSRVLINLDDSKSDTEPEVSYPDICFSVDDFSETFRSMVLEDANDCYCVLLHANTGTSWKRALKYKQPTTASSSCGDEGEKDKDEEATLLAKLSIKDTTSSNSDAVLVFSGYVSFEQLSIALSGRPSVPFKFLFNGGRDTVRVLMHGPDGIGNADVAVTAFCDRDALESSEGVQGKSGGALQGASSFFKRVANISLGGGKNPFKGGNEDDRLLQCALMTLAVPVDMLARQVLMSLE